MFTRVYSRKDSETEPVSVRMTQTMIDAIEALCERTGESRNSTIIMLLDEHLQAKAKEGLIPWPKGHNPKAK